MDSVLILILKLGFAVTFQIFITCTKCMWMYMICKCECPQCSWVRVCGKPIC